MKRVIEDDGRDLLENLLGEKVTFFCVNYIYTGVLAGIDDKCVFLEKPYIVYQTGPFRNAAWADAQPLPHNMCIMLTAVESFGIVK